MVRHIKLVAVDLDHTILHDDKTLSSFTVEVFRRLRHCEVSTCVLTTRQKASAEALCSQLACCGTAFCNGAIVSVDGSVIARHSLNQQSARDFLHDIADYPCSVTCSDTVYTNFKTHYSIQVDSWSQLEGQELLRILLYKPPQELLEQLTATSYADLYIQHLEHNDIVAVSRLATKERALEILMEHWGIYSKETAAFGDDFNDIGFIALAGTGIAVQNAEEQVRLTADVLCASNNEDGPALWLNEYVLRPLNAEVR
jgi:Cof subfamily protein (haloacid dehalogenase superfamily)